MVIYFAVTVITCSAVHHSELNINSSIPQGEYMDILSIVCLPGYMLPSGGIIQTVQCDQQWNVTACTSGNDFVICAITYTVC